MAKETGKGTATADDAPRVKNVGIRIATHRSAKRDQPMPKAEVKNA